MNRSSAAVLYMERFSVVITFFNDHECMDHIQNSKLRAD